jgi:hypothetical protein
MCRVPRYDAINRRCSWEEGISSLLLLLRCDAVRRKRGGNGSGGAVPSIPTHTVVLVRVSLLLSELIASSCSPLVIVYKKSPPAALLLLIVLLFVDPIACTPNDELSVHFIRYSLQPPSSLPIVFVDPEPKGIFTYSMLLLHSSLNSIQGRGFFLDSGGFSYF